jgi:hypothetical protein
MMNDKEILCVTILLTKISPEELIDVIHNKEVEELIGTQQAHDFLLDIKSRSTGAIANLKWDKEND